MWGAALKTHLHSLEVTQRRFLKLIYSKKSRYPTETLYTETKIMDIRQLYFFCCSNKYHVRKHQGLVYHEYNTRQKCRYLAPLMFKVVSQRSFSYFASKLYNIIPESIQTESNLYTFKKRLKQFILANSRSMIHDYFEN